MKLMYEYRTPQANNTCEGCSHLEYNKDIKNLCYEYPSMENMVRCIQYQRK